MATVEEFMNEVKANNAAAVAQMLSTDNSLLEAKEGGNSAVLTAAYYGARDVVDVLLQHGAKPSFFEAAAIGDLQTLRAHLEEYPDKLDSYSHDGFTVLGLAAFFGHTEIVAHLLAQGANVDAVAQNPMKVTALHSAVAHRHTGIAESLVRYGANVNAVQQLGFTPLLEAVQNQQLDMIRMLIANGADATQALEDGTTALQMAEAAGAEEVITILRQAGAEK